MKTLCVAGTTSVYYVPKNYTTARIILSSFHIIFDYLNLMWEEVNFTLLIFIRLESSV